MPEPPLQFEQFPDEKTRKQAHSAALGQFNEALAVLVNNGRHVAIGEALDKLISVVSMVQICRYAEVAENSDGTETTHTIFTVSACKDDGKWVSFQREELLDAISASYGVERRKKCPTCEEWKPLSHFPYSKRGTYNRDLYCNVCNRRRVAEHAKRTKGNKKPTSPWKNRQNLKYCPGCRQNLDKRQFARDGGRKDRKQQYCRACKRLQFAERAIREQERILAERAAREAKGEKPVEGETE